MVAAGSVSNRPRHLEGKRMRSKQLANVLIKILGLSLVVHGIPGVIGVWYSSLFNGLQLVLLPALGIFLIVKSRVIAEFLFKNEDE